MLKLLIVVLVFAAVTYFVTRALQQRGSASPQPRRPRPKRPAPRPRPVAPDDDEDFLRELERKKREKPPEDGSAA